MVKEVNKVLKIKDFMVTDVITIKSSQTVYEAVELMVTNSVSCLVVIDNKKPIGVITERSIVTDVAFKGKDPKKTLIKNAMQNIAIIDPEKDFFSLVAFMRGNNLRRVVIVEKGKLAGIVTETDIVKAMIQLQKSLEGKTTVHTKKMKAMIDKFIDVSGHPSLKKLDSGYKEFNKVLKGGFPYNKSILLVGPPGSGKGLIAFNFMKTGLEQNEKVVYICMNEFMDDIKELFFSIGVNIEKYQKDSMFKVVNMYEEVIKGPERILDEEEKLLVRNYSVINESLKEILKDSSTPTRCVVNVISQSFVMHNPKTVYRFILMLNNLLKQNGVTTLYFMHKGDEASQHITTVSEVMDGVLEFNIEGEGEDIRRELVIRKMKPEFSDLPQIFTYKFDKNKNFTLMQKKG